MINTEKVIFIIGEIGKEIIDQKLFLTELDNPIGDGDHGINMARGFEAVAAKMPAVADKDIGTVLKTTGMALVSTVGGASGPLYGTAYMNAGKAMAGKNEMDINDFTAVLSTAIDGVKMRGKGTTGEKTMLDAMVPAKEAIEKALADGKDYKAALEAGVAAAKDGVEYTKTIIATKGRASYVGERSIGHQDPGATSFTLMLEQICKNV